MLYWLFTEGRSLLSALLFPLLMPDTDPADRRQPHSRRGHSPDGKRTQRLQWNSAVHPRKHLCRYPAGTNGVVRRFARRSGGAARTRSPCDQSADTAGHGCAAVHRCAALVSVRAAAGVGGCGRTVRCAQRAAGWRLAARADGSAAPSPGDTRRARFSAFCTPREFRRFRRTDPDGLTLLGAFWGADRRRLDFGAGRFGLSGEDAARGLLALGGPGSGKTQGIILPAIADRMQAGHSLIIADPQGELLRRCCDSPR